MDRSIIDGLQRIVEKAHVITDREQMQNYLADAADGNLYIHIMKREGGAPEFVETLRNQLYRVAIDAGGVITGEHGTGKI